LKLNNMTYKEESNVLDVGTKKISLHR
jgi:hypothetical protein